MVVFDFFSPSPVISSLPLLFRLVGVSISSGFIFYFSFPFFFRGAGDFIFSSMGAGVFSGVNVVFFSVAMIIVVLGFVGELLYTDLFGEFFFPAFLLSRVPPFLFFFVGVVLNCDCV